MPRQIGLNRPIVLNCTSPIKLANLRRPAMSDDAADYGGSSDAGSLSEGDQAPSRLPARAESWVGPRHRGKFR